jgi:class 3 adenylate cyclase
MTGSTGATLLPKGHERRLSRRQTWAYVCLGAVTFAITTMIAVCAINAGALVGQPFAGFLFNQNLKVAMTGEYHWSGSQAGLKYPDKVLHADQQPLRSPDELKALVRSLPVGTPIRYLVDRDGRSQEISVRTMEFGWSDYGLTFGLLAFTALIYLVIGGTVFVLKPFERQTWTFLLACWLLSLYTATTFDLVSTLEFIRLHFTVHAFVPAAFVHFSLYFPRPKPIVLKRPWLQVVPYLGSLALLVPLQILNPHDSAIIFLKLINAYLIAASLIVLYPIIKAYVRPESVIGRQRAKVVLFGAGVAFPIPASAFFAQFVFGSFLGVPIKTNLLTFPLLFFPASIGYAIARHNLFDVDEYIKRTVGYVIMTVVVGLGYFSVQTLVGNVVLKPIFGDQAEHIYPIVFAILVVFFFNPINRKVQDGVDRVFFRKAFDYKKTIAIVSEALSSIADLNGFLTTVIETLRRDLFVNKAGVVLVDARQHTCQTVFLGDGPSRSGAATEDPCFLPSDPLLTLLATEKKLITKYDVAEDPQYEKVREACGQRFEELGTSVAVPLYYRDEFSGMLALGYKKSGHFYTRDDIELVQTLSTMTSTAIEQGREKAQREVLMKLFSKHVSPEVAEVLWQQREQFLDGGRPRSQKLLITAMFTDLQGFSTISEKQSPEVLMGWLNSYLEMMTTTVMEHGGVVDDFFGDGIKINFGVPIPRETEAEIRQDAINAVNCALAMEQRMIEMNTKAAAQGQQPLRMRIGINTGPVVAGSLGSADRMKYTTLGDTVNTAARLESFSKEVDLSHLAASPCRILIGDTTLRYLDDRFQTERVGELELKGKAKKVEAYCVLGLRTGARENAVSPTQ